jgi:hypothetical protein
MKYEAGEGVGWRWEEEGGKRLERMLADVMV